jgi:hypothetical protein
LEQEECLPGDQLNAYIWRSGTDKPHHSWSVTAVASLARNGVTTITETYTFSGGALSQSNIIDFDMK